MTRARPEVPVAPTAGTSSLTWAASVATAAVHFGAPFMFAFTFVWGLG